ncbi:hypothetical protein L198_06771 [Cryptococcus wingfieldii CBS 7118]|uniref:Uncharacterized protein n=1 Tax=Cryptococcus wingfieldii CBS 7118 TaxID=1295528 RepID=A0A1E3IHF7_9TREE|nr:hypothetical protein L198_06771 [Cryptococcus wingfieldii CBS 7118]ODN88034.1 hypothetical protein L198_06771 [Cryptococcus wingfieldii CBS 7118]
MAFLDDLPGPLAFPLVRSPSSVQLFPSPPSPAVRVEESAPRAHSPLYLRSLRAFPLPTRIARPRLGGIDLSATLHTHSDTGTSHEGEEPSPVTASLKRALSLLAADATSLNVRRTIEDTVAVYRQYVIAQEKPSKRLSYTQPKWEKGWRGILQQGTGGVSKTLLDQHEDLLREMLIEAGTTEEKEIG